MEQRFLALRGAYELKGHMPPVSPKKRNRLARAGFGRIDTQRRLGVLLYCNVDALQGDRTLTRDGDSIVSRLLRELMRPKLWKSSFAYGSAKGVC